MKQNSQVLQVHPSFGFHIIFQDSPRFSSLRGYPDISYWDRLRHTMNTSNSSRHLKGDSIASHSANMKQTVEKDLSPPESAFTSLCDSPAFLWGCTWNKRFWYVNCCFTLLSMVPVQRRFWKSDNQSTALKIIRRKFNITNMKDFYKLRTFVKRFI